MTAAEGDGMIRSVSEAQKWAPAVYPRKPDRKGDTHNLGEGLALREDGA